MPDRDVPPPHTAEEDGPDDYEVGRGRPPLNTRFQKGRSGNPRGRPRGTSNKAKIARTIANEMQSVTIDGRRRKMRNIELVLLALERAAIQKNLTAFRFLEQLSAKYGVNKKRKVGFLILPEEMTREEWVAKYGMKNPDPVAEPEPPLKPT